MTRYSPLVALALLVASVAVPSCIHSQAPADPALEARQQALTSSLLAPLAEDPPPAALTLLGQITHAQAQLELYHGMTVDVLPVGQPRVQWWAEGGSTPWPGSVVAVAALVRVEFSVPVNPVDPDPRWLLWLPGEALDGRVHLAVITVEGDTVRAGREVDLMGSPTEVHHYDDPPGWWY